jgi:hypothetical protein
MKANWIIVFLVLIGYSLSYAQSYHLKNEILKLKISSDSSIKKYPAEKIYMQFDKPYYASGDTAWFKIYLFNAPSHLLSANSGLLYIDLIGDSNKLVKQYTLPVANGVSWGNIMLSDKDFRAGTYTLQAYTNWMRNFGEEGFYYKRFYVSAPNESNWLVNSRGNTSKVNDKYLVNARLQFTDIDKTPVAGQPVELQIMAGTKNWYKQKMQTDPKGILDINFALPEKSSHLSIVADDEQKNQKVIIPLNLNRPETADMQFLPEGGNLVAFLPANIGFKMIGQDGKGIDISGIVTDHNQQQVASFHSLQNGIGSFNLATKNGERYMAKVTFPGGAIKDYDLPLAQNSGTILHVKNVMQSDSVEISLMATDDIVQSGNNYFLIGKARGIICYEAIVNFHNSNLIQRKIAKSLLPSGIAHFTLTTTKEQPLNERLVFIDRHDNLDIQLSSDIPDHAAKDSIALQIKVSDDAGNPVNGSFSLAVTDDALVNIDTLHNGNIITHLLLTSDLKGYVEEPGYYFQDGNITSWQALDNLLITQGWIGYEPTQSNLPYPAEQEYVVQGKVTNIFNKPVKQTKVLLFSGSPYFMMNTLTDNDGRFTFRNFPKVDTPKFVLKAVNTKGISADVNIHIEEAPRPVFGALQAPLMLPWYVNSDTTLMNYVRVNIAGKKQQSYVPDGKHRLNEVIISAKKTIKGSQNLNGSGNADQVIDEKEVEQAGKISWLQLLQEKIKGFREGSFTYPSFGYGLNPPYDCYFIKDKMVIIIIDGELLNVASLLECKSFLKLHNAEDIRGIEVINSYKYLTNYETKFGVEQNLKMPPFCFMEITTRAGNGQVITNTPGMYLYKPLAISWPKQFYKPRYLVRDTVTHAPDLRSTIDWEPNVLTDADGKATVWFYAGDKSATYTIIVEGTDFNGSLGYKQRKIVINEKPAASKSK